MSGFNQKKKKSIVACRFFIPCKVFTLLKPHPTWNVRYWEVNALVNQVHARTEILIKSQKYCTDAGDANTCVTFAVKIHFSNYGLFYRWVSNRKKKLSKAFSLSDIIKCIFLFCVEFFHLSFFLLLSIALHTIFFFFLSVSFPFFFSSSMHIYRRSFIYLFHFFLSRLRRSFHSFFVCSTLVWVAGIVLIFQA